MKLSQRVKIKSAQGLHARPATKIVQLLQNCRSNVSFTYRKDTINARSIMSILMLAAPRNAQITITVDGDDAQETLHNLVTAFEQGFKEQVDG